MSNWANVVGYYTSRLFVRGKHSEIGRSELITSEKQSRTSRRAATETQLEQFVNFLAAKPTS